MTDYFLWNGVKSTDYGIHVSEHPPITLPAERQTATSIPGRSGSLITLEGDDVYDEMTLSCTCWMDDTAKIPAIAQWLKGSGTITFANRLGGYYEARVTNQISFAQVLKGRPHCSFSVNFRCQPFFYLDDSEDITMTTSGMYIENKGTVFAEPVLQVTLSSDAEITLGGKLFELTGVTGTVTIDTPKQECYQEYTSMNGCMSGDYPIIPVPGAYVSWTGGVEKIVVEPHWRCL